MEREGDRYRDMRRDAEVDIEDLIECKIKKTLKPFYFWFHVSCTTSSGKCVQKSDLIMSNS